MDRSTFAPLVALGFLAAGVAGGCDSSPPPVMPTGGCGMPAYEWLPRSAVGDVIASREADLTMVTGQTIDVMLAAGGAGDFFSPVPYGARLFHLRYGTQDRGQAVEATGFVAVPWIDGAPRRRFPVVLLLHGTTGFMGECAPSHIAGEGVSYGLMLFASLGYIVVAPDYIGLDADADFSQPPPVKHAYLGLEQTGIGSLDMVRAARAFLQETDLAASPADDLVLWGGSQGGHAAFAVDLVAPYYAPELQVRASVAMVPATDLLGLTRYALSDVNDATPAVAAALTGLHFWHQGPEPLDTLLTDEPPWNLATAVPEVMYSGCDAGGAFDGLTAVSQVYQPDAIAAATAASWDAFAPWSCYLATNSIDETPIPRLRATPTLFIVAQNDTLVAAQVERDDFPRLCALGYRLQYLECADASHTEGAAWSLPEQTAWVAARLAGEPLDDADLCVVTPPVRCSGQPTK